MDDVTPPNQLSASARLRRLHHLAVYALSKYPVLNPTLRFHGSNTNVLYRVTADSDERFMLRLATPGWRSFQDLNSEAMWLNAIGEDTSIPVPGVIPTNTGEYVLPLSLPELPGVWNATLMTWVPGRLLGRHLTPQNLEKMGELFARLHSHGAVFNPPVGFTTCRFENWLSRGEENLIMGSEGHASEAQYRTLKALTAGQWEILQRLDQRVNQAYAAIDRSDLRVIHCDLWHDNIKLHHGVLHPFDFEDTVWGFRCHDIAMAMLDLQDETGEESYRQLFAAFKKGYAALLSWPDNPIEPMQIGRLLWKINWVAGHEPQWLPNMVERYLPVFENFEQTGTVILPGG